MKENQEWKVQESWVLTAIDMYLQTITVCANSGKSNHKCTSIKPNMDKYNSTQEGFVLYIEQEKEEPIIVVQ